MTESADVGTQLLGLLRPKGTPRAGTTKELREAIDQRDRFWTLLVHGHNDLRRAGAWLFGTEVDQHVPPLQSRQRLKKKPPAAPPSTPASK